MMFSHVFQALGSLTARFVPPPEPLEIDLDGHDAPDPFAQAAIGTWLTEDGAIRLDLRPDGRFDKRKAVTASRHGGRYEVDRSKLYFEDDAGMVALGRLRRGVLDIGEKRFLKA